MPNLDDFAGTLPYASELFGVYQPVMGWQSRRIKRKLHRELVRRLDGAVSSLAAIRMHERDIVRFEVSRSATDALLWRDDPLTSVIAEKLGDRLMRRESLSADHWRSALSTELLDESCPEALERAMRRAMSDERIAHGDSAADLQDLFRRQIAARRSVLLHMRDHYPELLNTVFKGRARASVDQLSVIGTVLGLDGFATQAVLSPVGLLHSFRQYFFELNRFLGPPVGHVWLSPGSMVELVEASTRRTLMERMTESSFEIVQKTELATETADELADAVRVENANDMKLGVTASGGVNFKVWHAEASASFSLDQSRKQASESTHKRSRRQSEKLTSEIRRNFKTTFRTVTESTDTSSRRYVINNTTQNLVNYELCRKMRRVGVQLQHIGSTLCWQIYVDDPGRDLGIGVLIHNSNPKDATQAPPSPEAPPAADAKVSAMTADFRFIDLKGATEDSDQTFDNGKHSPDVGKDSFIQNVQQFKGSPPPGYELTKIEIKGVTKANPEKDTPDPFVPQTRILDPKIGTFEIALTSVNFQEQPFIPIHLELTFEASKALSDRLRQDYEDKVKEYTASKQRAEHEEFVKAVRERIKAAGDVRTRPFDELREEERHIVYRRIIKQLTFGEAAQDIHVTSELIRRLFDIDSMLYFVAPDWWVSRPRSGLEGGTTTTGPDNIGPSDMVSWGGGSDPLRDKYFVTETSNPVPTGASLGWLLQLDADAMRNAFLNSAWVKAVVPIRNGREHEAIDWLVKHVEGADGLDAIYAAGPGDPPEYAGKTVRQVLDLLITRLQADYKVGNTLNPTLNSLPTEVMYERGFDPLAGGVRVDAQPYAVFDQWIEVMPTDQIVAKEYTE